MKRFRTLIKNIAFGVGILILLLVPVLASRSSQTTLSQATSVAVRPVQTDNRVEISTSPAPTSRTTATPTSTPVPVSTFDVVPDALRDLNISFWHPWVGESGKALERLVREFNTSNEWGITVTIEAYGDYDTQFEAVLAALQAGNAPELALAYPYQSLSWEAKHEGILADLGLYVNDAVWGFRADEINEYYPVFWEQDMIAGKRVGLPVTRSAQVLYYNTTWAGELGFTRPPVTPEQFKRQACAAANANNGDEARDNDNTGGWIIATDYLTVLGWLYAFDNQVTNPAGNGYRLGTDEVSETLTFLRDLHESGCAWLSENFAAETEFANRRGLFAAGTVTGIARQEDAFADAESKDEWTVIPFPGTKEPAISAFGPSFTLLESNPEEQLASWLFLRWLSQPDKQARLVQASGAYPARATAVDLLEFTPLAQWTAAVDLIPYARAEPNLRSWRTVRWAVSDSATQLFRWYFTRDQLPATVKLLGETADELQRREP